MTVPLDRRAPVGGTFHAHGGDVDAVSREYGIPIDDLVDFSANINPLGPPQGVLARLRRESADPSLLGRYPDPSYADLRGALATHLRVPPDCLTIANGSAALYGAVTRGLTPATCVLAVPAFGEQRRALDAAGWNVDRFSLKAADDFRLDVDALCDVIEARRPALCLLTNPHNPSGVLTTALDMMRVVRAAAASDTWLVIDEAFIDYAVGESLTEEATRWAEVVVLRSLTKFYGMPALRVGYAISAAETGAQIAAQLPAWPVTTLAANAGAEAVRDLEYRRHTLVDVATERQRLRDALATLGLGTYAAAANFVLLRLPERGLDSTRLRARLIGEHRIIVRDCRSFDGLDDVLDDGRFIRVAVRTRDENDRLVRALRAVLEGGSRASE
jgi:threonine-phosphate decarboxylase